MSGEPKFPNEGEYPHSVYARIRKKGDAILARAHALAVRTSTWAARNVSEPNDTGHREEILRWNDNHN